MEVNVKEIRKDMCCLLMQMLDIRKLEMKRGLQEYVKKMWVSIQGFSFNIFYPVNISFFFYRVRLVFA